MAQALENKSIAELNEDIESLKAVLVSSLGTNLPVDGVFDKIFAVKAELARREA